VRISNKLTVTLVLIGLHAFSARVAVTDSGTDFQHEWLKGRELINTAETAGNRVDDDRNGKVDDIVGWNFADNYGKVFFRDHVSSVNVKVFKVMDVLSRIQAGEQTPEDEKYWKENITSLKEDEKKKLIAELNYYGQYAHSTHVSGIIASVAPNSRMISNRVFPDTPMNAPISNMTMAMGVSDIAYKALAILTNGTFEKVGTYLAERKIDVANYSLGTNLQMIAGLALNARRIPKPTPEQLSIETKRLFTQFEPVGKKWMSAASGTLFVVAAGNDGTSNDALPVFPSNVNIENKISVAASQGVTSLAKFSNYGLSVDVAAPGVAIKSSVPSIDNKVVLPMSGTSMAAPYVAGVAAQMKDINPKLTPFQMKQILMGTVDKKDWLKQKVVTSGVVNADRAYAAAELSKSMTLQAAIDASIQNVADQKEVSIPKRIFKVNEVTKDMQDMANKLVF
jgi:cell wall-associated protease